MSPTDPPLGVGARDDVFLPRPRLRTAVVAILGVCPLRRSWRLQTSIRYKLEFLRDKGPAAGAAGFSG